MIVNAISRAKARVLGERACSTPVTTERITQRTRWSAILTYLYYLCISLLFIHLYGFFNIPTRPVEESELKAVLWWNTPGYVAAPVLCPTVHLAVCEQPLKESACSGVQVYSAPGPRALEVSADGTQILVCGSADVAAYERVVSTYVMTAAAPISNRQVVVTLINPNSELTHEVAKLTQEFDNLVNFEHSPLINVASVGRTTTTGSILCGASYEKLWNDKDSLFSPSNYTIALRLRQSMEGYILPDILSLTTYDEPPVHLILWSYGDEARCLGQHKVPMMVELKDRNILLLIPVHSATSSAVYVPHVKAQLRTLLGLSAQRLSTQLSILENIECTDHSDYISGLDMGIVETALARQLKAELLASVEEIRRVEQVRWMSDWSNDTLIRHFIHALQDKGIVESPTTLLQLLQLARSVLNTTISKRRMFLPPSFVVALYGPVTVALIMPATTLGARLMKKDRKAWLRSLLRHLEVSRY